MEAQGPPPPPPPPPTADDAAVQTPEDLGLQEPSAPSAADPPTDAGVVPLAPDEVQMFQEAAASSSSDPIANAEGEGLQEATAPSGAALLSDDLRNQIVRQVEYYFSDENLPTDKYLLKYVKKGREGFVPLAVIASFRRMKKLVQDISLVAAALRTSSQLVVSLDGRKVRRLNPLPVTAIQDGKSRTVVVENLPEDNSTECIQKIFGNVGKITNITIRDPHSTEESALTRKTEMTISSKLHALVEYETVEAAKNAVATLNDEKNWRSGMRVELLLKRMGKYGLIQRGQKQNQTSEMATDGQKTESVDDHEDSTVKEEVDRSTYDKCRGRRSRNKSRGRGHYQSSNGQGHGSVPSGSSNEGVSKPVPGPRMPDGTRGFTMGRGKPFLTNCTEQET